MRKQLLYLSAFIFFACSSSSTEDTSIQKDSIAISTSDTIATVGDSIKIGIDWNEPDPLKIAKLKEYTASWDNSYFPLPDVSMLKRYSQIDLGYVYLVHNFDTLHAKKITGYYNDEQESTGPNIPCAWEQEFKADISFATTMCSENGESSVIHTKCPDKKVLMRLIDILYHDTENVWSTDSCTYEPMEEGNGSYYNIEKNEDGGYDIQYYYSGC